MKTTFYLSLFTLLYIATFTSCNKSADNPTPSQLDSLNAALPKEVIISDSYDSSGIQVTSSDVVSIKYDTVKRTIQLYLDDTTTTNPYDVLGETYTYNSSGYLIGIKQADNSNNDQNSDPTYNITINRGADNNINYIAEVSKDGSWYDSIFYKYQPSNGGNIITTVDHYSEYGGIQGYTGEWTSVYTYNSNYRLTQLVEPIDQYTTATTNYTLNANGTIKSYVTTSVDTTIANYTYASGLPDGKADAFTQALLGKDYYLYGLMDMDPFVYNYSASSLFDNFNIPFTDAYHISAANLRVTGNNSLTETATWMYKLNAQNNVTQVDYSNNFNDKETIKIKY